MWAMRAVNPSRAVLPAAVVVLEHLGAVLRRRPLVAATATGLLKIILPFDG